MPSRSWTDLGKVYSGSDLAEGERVTVSVFDRTLKTLLEQTTFVPLRGHTGKLLWVMDLCRHVNGNLALIRAGMETATFDWKIDDSGDGNKFWGVTSRALKVVTTVVSKNNWSTTKRLALQPTYDLTTSSRVRMNVRNGVGDLLETVIFAPTAGRLTPGFWSKDFAAQINRTSLYVRAGKQDGELITPIADKTLNWIWTPESSDLSVTWLVDEVKEACKIPADRDAAEGEEISLFVFDDKSDKLLDRITLKAAKARNSLTKAQWPAELAKQINASSAHATATSTAINQKFGELRMFTTALHVDNWEQGSTIAATASLTAADRIVVTVSTAGKGNFCEVVTFTPDPARLTAAQWAKDLAKHINGHSRFLKAGVKHATNKTMDPTENASTNVIWLPKGSKLKVGWEKTQMKELGYISSERDQGVTESCRVYVMDDTTDAILREFTFTPGNNRNGKCSVAIDLARLINQKTELVMAGDRSNNKDGAPVPASSTYTNKIWSCANNVRCFTTLVSLKNFDKGACIGNRALVENEQVVLVVKGKKTGRILESMAFIPEDGRLSHALWAKDFASRINKRSRFIRAGRENATKGEMEPWHENNVNFFWVPKASGLDVEMQIISGISWPLPGMSSEARELFEQYSETYKHITIDSRTGQGELHIPVAELFVDDDLKDPMKVSLSYAVEDGISIQVGGGARRTQGALYAQKFLLALRDGRHVEVSLSTKAMQGGDFKITPFKELLSTDKAQKISVSYKDGSGEVFKFLTLANLQQKIVMERCWSAAGGRLEFMYGSYGELQKIQRKDKVSLVEVTWPKVPGFMDTMLPTNIVVYPGSTSERKTFTFTAIDHKGEPIKMEVDGLESSGKILYTIKSDSLYRLSEVQTVRQRTETDRVVSSETLEYDSYGRVLRHVISPGIDMDALVHDYAYAGQTTTLMAFYKAAAPRCAFIRNFDFNGGQLSVENYGSSAAPICKQRSYSLDSARRCVDSRSQSWEGDVPVDHQILTVDVNGNPTRRENNQEVTEWTYYNNYQQFTVTETKVKVEDWSLFGCLFKGLDYLNPVGQVFGLAGSSGMTWGTRIDSTVEMTATANNYAKKAFNLPVDITHCGSDRPFTGDVESELISRKVGEKEEPQRLTFFGYDNVAGQIRVKHKLTILQPDCSRVNVEAEQLAVATEAAKAFTKSLEDQIKAASDKEKPAYQKTLDDLTASLKAQSKANNEGFKLNSKKGASMTLETFEYHTEKDKPGYGMVSSSSVAQIVLSAGVWGVYEASRVTTKYTYKVDTADTNKLTITTTISQTGQSDITSSQTRSRLSGRLLESTDSEGYKTVRTYDPQGNLKSETLSKGGSDLRKTTCTLASGLVWQYEMVEDGATTRIDRDILGRRKSQHLKPNGATSLLETHSWTYDTQGRITSTVETDYGTGNARISQRESKRVYDVSGKITTTNLLKDKDGKELGKVIQERTPGVRGERFTQGKFSIDRQFNANKSTLTELYSQSGSEGCKIEKIMSADGQVKSVRYLKVESGNKETEQDKIEYGYDKYGQLISVTPKIGGAISYSYDCAGRLLKTTREGIVLENSYDPATLAPIAGEAYVKNGAASAVKLGRQSVDMLGRASSQTINDHTIEFSYNGASTTATRKIAVTGPTALSDYSGDPDKAKRIHSQKLGTETSTLEFSTGGRVLKFTDLSGAVTTYEYDFFDRLTRSKSDHCICTWTYADNGLLTSETITAVKSANLVMTVVYTYDGLGQETKRTFTCPGVDTLTLDRTLLGDGRLSKSTLKSAKTDAKQVVTVTEQEVNSYEYDKTRRLTKWIGPSSRTDTWTYDALGNALSHANSSSGNSDLFYLDDYKPGVLNNVVTQKTSLAVPATALGTAFTHDNSGRLTIEGTRRLGYHGNGQVNTYSTDGDKTKYTFSYDKEGRVRGGSIGNKTDTYHYRGDCVYALVQTDSTTGASFKKRSLIVRNESRACLLQDAITDSSESRSFELRDANGTVFASIDLATKAITYFRYEPYGKRYSGTKATNWLGFKGEPLNSLGLYHLGNGYRLYDPALCRFLSRDSNSPFGIGGAGGYVFGNADPVNNADPSGRAVVAQYSRWSNAPAIQSMAFRIVAGAVGVLLAPFTAGTSMLLAVATTALAAISFAFDVASIIIAESDPQLSRTLEAWGQAFGIASAAAGISMGLHGIKGLPRNWFRARGGSLSKVPVKWPTVPSELRLAQQARAKALTQLIQNMDEAKAAGKFDAFKAAYLNNGTEAAGGLFLSGGFKQQISSTTRNLYKGTVRQFDDSLFDLLGYTLDFYTGPNVLVQKFIPPKVSETEIRSLVGMDMPGREDLFK